MDTDLFEDLLEDEHEWERYEASPDGQMRARFHEILGGDFGQPDSVNGGLIFKNKEIVGWVYSMPHPEDPGRGKLAHGFENEIYVKAEGREIVAQIFMDPCNVLGQYDENQESYENWVQYKRLGQKVLDEHFPGAYLMYGFQIVGMEGMKQIEGHWHTPASTTFGNFKVLEELMKHGPD